MNRATRKDGSVGSGVTGGSSTTGGGRGWSWNTSGNLRSLLFSPSPTTKGTPRKSSKSSRSKLTPPPKKTSSTATATTNSTTQPLVLEETSSHSSTSTINRNNSADAAQRTNNRHSGSRRWDSSSTASSTGSTRRSWGRLPPQPSSDTENTQSVEKSIPQQQQQQQQQKMDHTSLSSEKRRSFGEKIDGNNMVFDTSLVSAMESSSKDATTAYSTSSTSGGIQLLNSNSTSEDCNNTVTSSSDCAQSEVSNVSALRGWLDDFGKQQQQHYQEKTSSKALPPTDAAVKPPTRSKVGPNKKTKSVEVSVPPKPCNLPTKTATSASAVKATGSLSQHHQNHHHHVLPASHYHHQPASNLAKRLEDTGLSARSRTTPIRLKPKFQEDDVKATNEGYKSVAKLSAWLADDPTKTKKVRQIRRGANVIAKSKTFDKGLADMIIEDLNIPTGLVRNAQKLLLESSMMSEFTDDNDDEKSFWPGDLLPSQTPSTLSHSHRDNFETSSAVCVSDKKAWLQSAFKKTVDTPCTTTTSLRPKAKTDVITAQDQRDDVSARAKHLWRNRPTTATNVSSSSSTCSSARRYYHTPCAASREEDTSSLCNTSMHSHCSSVTMEQRQGIIPTVTFLKQTSPLLSKGYYKTTNQTFDESPNNDNNMESSDFEEEAAAELPANFQAARNLILERAKQNGCDVNVMTKVKLRQQKFEQLHKDAERRRNSLPYDRLKPSWESGGGGGSVSAAAVPGTTYVKTFVKEKAPPKKTLRDLP